MQSRSGLMASQGSLTEAVGGRRIRTREHQPVIVGFEDERGGPRAKECGSPLSVGKVKTWVLLKGL